MPRLTNEVLDVVLAGDLAEHHVAFDVHDKSVKSAEQPEKVLVFRKDRVLDEVLVTGEVVVVGVQVLYSQVLH